MWTSSLTKNNTFLLFLILFPLYLTWTFDHSLWNPDETRDAGIAREMYVTKDFVTPHLNGEPFLEKPPLYYWSTAVVYKVAGRVTDGLTRLPAALYGLLGIFFTFLIGRRLYSPRIGLIAAGVLATGFQYFRMSHMALMDSSLAALITGAFYFYLLPNILLFALFVTLAFFTKGFVAVALTGIVIGVDLIIKKDFKRLLTITLIGTVVFAVLVGPWVHLLWKAGGEYYFRMFFIDNNWNRFFSPGTDHKEPFYFYFGSFPMDFLLWTPLFLMALVSAIKNKTERQFPFIWFTAMFIFLTLSSSKRSIYMMPVFPAAALMLATWLDQKSWGWKTFVSISVITAVLIVGADIFFIKKLDRDKSFLPVVNEIKRIRGDSQLLGFDLSEMERGVFPFYLEENIAYIETTDGLKTVLKANKGKSILLLANRNKLKDIEPVLGANHPPVFTFRPDKKTRSYLLYEIR